MLMTAAGKRMKVYRSGVEFCLFVNSFTSLEKMEEVKMRKLTTGIIVLFCLVIVSAAYGIPFEPPTVTVTGEECVWTGGNCIINFTLEGRDCNVYLAVYTKGLAGTYGRVTNGFGPEGIELDDYHTVVGLDTCVFISPAEPFSQGSRHITWNGIDKVGRQMEPGEYTYYLIAADEFNDPVQFCAKYSAVHEDSVGYPTYSRGEFYGPGGAYYNMNIQYETAGEGKLEKPRVWGFFSYFELGQNTEDNVWVTYTYPEGTSANMTTQIDPDNDDIIFHTYWDADAESAVFAKSLLNPDGPGELVTDFAEEGKFYYYGAARCAMSGGNAKDGVCIAGSYDPNETYATMYVFDSEYGETIDEYDAYEWGVSPQEDIDRGATPSNFGDMWSWSVAAPTIQNVHWCSCHRISVNPFLGEDNWLVWANMNGDYYCDHFAPGCEGFNEDMVWVCNSCSPGAFQYGTYTDQYNFTFYTSNWDGPHQMDVLGPDGYGIFKFHILGQVQNPDRWYAALVHGNTPYDGMYSPLTTGEDEGDTKLQPSWVGYDNFQGKITAGVGVDDATPAAYSLSNAPDPFNPATTISYGIAKAGHVTLDVYNVMGQKVATLYDGQRDSGAYSIRWDASDFANGVYFAVMQSGDITKTEKMMLVK